MNREELAKATLAVLQQAGHPLGAREICSTLRRSTTWAALTTGDVNSILYEALDQSFVRDSNYRWTLKDPEGDSSRTRPPPGDDAQTQEDVTLCPQCGSPMTVKTVRNGPRAGSRFYGCSRYPDCRGTRELNEEAVGTEHRRGRASTAGGRSTPASDFPREVTIQPLPGEEVVLVESAAIPRSLLSDLDSIAAPFRRAYSQWAIRIPGALVDQATPYLSEPWYHVAEKILTRGAIVPLSPQLESHLIPDLPNGQLQDWGGAIKRSSTYRKGQPLPIHYGSEAERDFAERTLEAIGRAVSPSWLLGQVSSAGLIGERGASGARVDFVFAHPGDTPRVIEIDGAQHEDAEAVDEARDEALVSAGFSVHRIPTSEVEAGRGPAIAGLEEHLKRLSTSDGVLPLEDSALLLCKRAHQIQLALLFALGRAVFDPPTLEVDVLIDLPIGTNKERFLDAVFHDFEALLDDIAKLYPNSSAPPRIAVAASKPRFLLDFVDRGAEASVPKIRIYDVFLPVRLSRTQWSLPTPAKAEPSLKICERVLERIFGYSRFREGQYEAISRALQGEDSLVLLPTGSGKSIAFQLAALLRSGPCIVVDPLLSLVEDQVENLRAVGIDRVGSLTSAHSLGDRLQTLELLKRGEYLFVYVAPERFQSQSFRNALKGLTTATPISLIAIDEAHCVSEWGHDFRPAYLNLARIAREYCATGKAVPPLMGLTGTASKSVLKDTQRELGIRDFEAVITPKTFDRPELSYRAVACKSVEKQQVLESTLDLVPRELGGSRSSFFSSRGRNTSAGLIFCPHVNGPFGVVDVAGKVSKHIDGEVLPYAGSAPKNVDGTRWDSQKRRNTRRFKRDEVTMLACTKAFGMGIDKPNVRVTVHYCLPQSVEGFYQEAGRAGRDRKPAKCVVLYSNDFPERTAKLLHPAVPVDEVQRVLAAVPRSQEDDVTRALYFHAKSFTGVQQDYDAVDELLGEIGEIDAEREVQITYPDDSSRLTRERAIFRLLTVGVVADYTIDFTNRAFTVRLAGADNGRIRDALVRYIGAYQRGPADAAERRLSISVGEPNSDFVRKAVRVLIEFVYEVIERSRRQALSNILNICSAATTGEELRELLLASLDSSFEEAINRVIEGSEGGLKAAIGALDEVRSTLDATHISGESARALESYPDHPGLRLLRGIAELLRDSPDASVVSENIEACVRFASEKYNLREGLAEKEVLSAAASLGRNRPQRAEELIRALIEGSPDKRGTARKAVSVLPRNLRSTPVLYLLAGMTATVDQLPLESNV